jgi:hypothetical protein
MIYYQFRFKQKRVPASKRFKRRAVQLYGSISGLTKEQTRKTSDGLGIPQFLEPFEFSEITKL